MNIPLPDAVNDARGQAFLGTLEYALGTLDLTALLVAVIDNLPDSALPAVAWQYDMLSPEWQLLLGAATINERAMLQQSIPLHRQMGTPSAISDALTALGWTAGVTLQEGEASWGGTSYPAAEGWAVFRVLINVPSTLPAPVRASDFDTQSGPAGDFDTLSGLGGDFDTIGAVTTQPAVLTVAMVTAAAAAANFFKPARCVLDSVCFVFPNVNDNLIPAPSDAVGEIDYLLPALSDAFTVVFAGVSDTLAFTPRYDKTYQHAGFTYANQPIGLSDGASTFNGAPVEGNQ